MDLLGVNYYTPLVVQAQPSEPADAAYPGSEGILFCTIPTAVTAMGWPIVPNGLSLLLGSISRDYPGLDLMVTENGADFVDVVTGDGIHDVERISFIEEHLRALRAAIDDGARVRGYLVWTLLDNLEWADGYQRKFGLVHVDFATQRRRMKDSALWYRDVIARNGLAETRPRRPTLETVAARAGVSRATVSRVVNGESSVSAEVRAAVMRAVKELGYVPNLAARSLVTRRTNAIALVLSVPRQGGDALTAAVVQYVTSLLEGAGKQITLMLADTAESHRRIARARRGPAGGRGRAAAARPGRHAGPSASPARRCPLVLPGQAADRVAGPVRGRGQRGRRRGGHRAPAGPRAPPHRHGLRAHGPGHRPGPAGRPPGGAPAGRPDPAPRARRRPSPEPPAPPPPSAS
ncbi:hypothetical protein GCM10020220_053890 [Nonomuraea rubra]|uniref:family 1 glycosylhydrolase n=1 Tax=Nonomuraea rubra TaxID=46180 RepID=UPI0031F011EA